jgi:hypothetical protein
VLGANSVSWTTLYTAHLTHLRANINTAATTSSVMQLGTSSKATDTNRLHFAETCTSDATIKTS